MAVRETGARLAVALAAVHWLGCAMADDGSRRETASAPVDAARAADPATPTESPLPAPCVGLLEVAGGGADADAGAGVEPAADDHARERFRDAVTAYSHGEYPHALEVFCELYREVPTPPLLFNVAATCEKLGLDRDAAAFFEAFAAAAPSPVADEARRRAAQLRGEPGAAVR